MMEETPKKSRILRKAYLGLAALVLALWCALAWQHFHPPGELGAEEPVTVPAQIAAISPGDAETVTIDGLQWYVLAKDGGKALLFCRSVLYGDPQVFDETANVWRDSDIRSYVNGAWLEEYPTLQAAAVETDISTRSASGSDSFLTTKDKVFFLSEADICGTQNRRPAKEGDYTYGGAPLPAPGGSWASPSIGHYYLRSPFETDDCVGIVRSDGSLGEGAPVSEDSFPCFRPALWVNLGALYPGTDER